MKKIVRDSKGTMLPGQDLVVAGCIGSAGASVIAFAKSEELTQRFSKVYVERIQKLPEDNAFCQTCPDYPESIPELWKSLGVTEWEPVGECGILSALWILSGAYETGIEFTLAKIPVKQETIEVCERYDLNPYRLYSEKCMVLVCKNGGQLVQMLENSGITAAVIGKVNSGIRREIISEDGVGYLDRPKKDELKKVVPGFFKNR